MAGRIETSERLAVLGGPKSVTINDPGLFHWPIVTAEDEAAVLDVMRTGAFSGIAITQEFEKEYSAYIGVKYSLGHCNGTALLLRGACTGPAAWPRVTR